MLASMSLRGFFTLALLLFAMSLERFAYYVVGAVITGVGEAMGASVPIAYASIAVRGRAAALVVAGWSILTLIVNLGGGALESIVTLRVPMLGICAFLCLAGGVALLALA